MARGWAKMYCELRHRVMSSVYVIRVRRAVAGGEALAEVGVVQQAELLIIDQFVLLALAQLMHSQFELLFDLVHWLVVEIGNAGMHTQHRLHQAEPYSRGEVS